MFNAREFVWCHFFFFFKQKTAYEMRISDWSSDVCSSDLQLSAFARKLPEQDLSAEADIPSYIAQLPSKQPDEVGRLASTFIFMDKQLRENIARLLRETSSRERLQSELSITHAIQMGQLTVPPPPDVLQKERQSLVQGKGVSVL